MARSAAIAVVDIGKSNAKLALVDSGSRAVVAMRTTPNAVLRGGPYPHFDVDRLWGWLIGGLAEFAQQAEITAISTTTHGASIAVVTDNGLALPVLDYEHDGPESVRAEYLARRGDYAETLSPELPNGLNVGRQLYWMSRTFPDDFAGATAIMPYPQYWVWRLSGSRVTEVTSLGAHTDLWNPRAATFSRLAAEEGWTPLFPPVVKAWEVVGALEPDVAAATGLSPSCGVIAGIHDSNASLYPHLLRRKPPFAVLSTGTWIIVFVPGGALERLDAKRDCLANVDAFGRPVPSARFMGGREFEILVSQPSEPGHSDIARVVAEEVMALPTFAPGIGPYGSGVGRWTRDPAALSAEERTAAASLYAALVADTCLGLAGADGPAIVEGPFSRNRLFLAALAQLTGRAVLAQHDATGTTEGAALLALGPDALPGAHADPPPTAPLDIDLTRYATRWREAAAGG